MEKIKAGKGRGSAGVWMGSCQELLNSVVAEKGNFEQIQAVNNGASQVNIWEKSVCKEKIASAKAPSPELRKFQVLETHSTLN